MRLLICGAGQYGLATKEIAEAMDIFSQIDFLDDQSNIAIGKLSDIDKIEYDAAIVAIGAPYIRKSLLEKIDKPATLIHPNATVMPSAQIGSGSIIEAGAVVCSNAKIGAGCIVMTNAVVGHDAEVQECCQLKYNCTIPERCIVPACTKVDCNVVFRDHTVIETINRKFVQEEKIKNGVEPNYF